MLCFQCFLLVQVTADFAWNHIPTISASCICRVLRLMKKYNPFQLFISHFNILQSPFTQTFTFIVVIWCYFDMLYLLNGNKSYPLGEIFPDILKALSRLHWCCFLSEFHHKRLRYLKTPAIAFFFVKQKFPTKNIIKSVEFDWKHWNEFLLF